MPFANLSPGVACVLSVDYYRSFVFTGVLPIVIGSLLVILVKSGHSYFNKLLRQFPCHCVVCGELLPNGGKQKHREFTIKRTDHRDMALHRPWLDLYRSDTHDECKLKDRPITGATLKTVACMNGAAFRSRVLNRINAELFRDKCFKLMFWSLTLCYPTISIGVLRLFDCTEVTFCLYNCFGFTTA